MLFCVFFVRCLCVSVFTCAAVRVCACVRTRVYVRACVGVISLITIAQDK